MKRILLSLCLLLVLFLPAKVQVLETGIPFITNYPTIESTGAQNWAVVQDHRGVMYFANDDGCVVEYDGLNWEVIPIGNQSFVRSLGLDENGTVFVGAVGEFGYLAPDEAGRLSYRSLRHKIDSSQWNFGDIWKTLSWQGNIYFCAPKKLFKYLASTDTIQLINPSEYGFSDVFFSFIANGKFYMGDNRQGLLELQGDSAVLAKGGEFFALKSIFTLAPLSDEELYIGAGRDGGFIYHIETGEVLPEPFPAAVSNLLKGAFVYHGIGLPDSKLALGTIYGAGGIILNRNGEIVSHFTKENGLQDETVTYLYVNPDHPGQSPLWFALTKGLAKAEINSPLRIFTEQNGFEGNINDIVKYKGILFLATQIGVYYMVVDDQQNVHFEKVEGITNRAWCFLKFDAGGAIPEKLLVGTEDGFFDASGINKAVEIKDRIIDLYPPDITLNIYHLYQSTHNPEKVILGLREGFKTIKYTNGNWHYEGEYVSQDEIRSVTEDEQGNLFVSSLFNGIYRFEFSEDGDTTITRYNTDDGLPTLSDIYIYKFNEGIKFATPSGIYLFDAESGKFNPDPTFGKEFHDGTIDVFRMVKDNDGDFWMSISREGTGNSETILTKKDGEYIAYDLPFRRLSNLSTDVFYPDENGIVWFGKSNELYRYDKRYEKDFTIPYRALIRQVILNGDSTIFYGTCYRHEQNGKLVIDLNQPEELKYSIKYDHNNITFGWAAPFFEEEEATEYRFWLEGNDKDWSHWSARTEFPYTNLSRGSYTFYVQAKNTYGIDSEISTFEFSILPPWHQTVWAFIGYIILFFALIVVIVKLYTRRLKMENIRLEGIVTERTAEVVRQKEELTDSIQYASRIQRALLPSGKALDEILPNYFILFKPRDIVSGDFYWVTQRESKVFVVAADCTGHGVPGAFMSMLGISFLNEIVNKSEITQSNQILDELREHVMQSLKQTGEVEGETKDGMDLALCVLDKENRHVQFSGAYNPLYFIRPLTEAEKKKIEKGEELDIQQGDLNNENYFLEQVKGDKMPIGISAKNHEPFSLNELDMKSGYTIYLLSDGYVDQFGGPEGKKFMSKAFKRLLLDIQDYPMPKQGEILDENIMNWMGDLPQVDDIIIIGMKLE